MPPSTTIVFLVRAQLSELMDELWNREELRSCLYGSSLGG